MSNFTVGPLPCKNADSFSKLLKPKENFSQTFNQKKDDMKVHRHVEGENNGKCYKIKSAKVPFILRHLEKVFSCRRDDEGDDFDEMVDRPITPTEVHAEARRTKRPHPGDDDDGDANQPSTSSGSSGPSTSGAPSRKRQRM